MSLFEQALGRGTVERMERAVGQRLLLIVAGAGREAWRRLPLVFTEAVAEDGRDLHVAADRSEPGGGGLRDSFDRLFPHRRVVDDVAGSVHISVAVGESR